MEKGRVAFLNLAIVVFAVCSYFWSYASIPDGYYHDTASVVLNAVCLRDTGSDEYGRHWPLTIRSFDDYKAPAFTYLLAALFSVVPPTLLASRLLSMWLGFLAVIGILVFSMRSSLFGQIRHSYFFSGGMFAFLLTPWILVVHRFPSEPSMVVLWVMLLFWNTFYLLQNGRIQTAILNGILIGLGVYVYHFLKMLFFAHFSFLACVIAFGTWKDKNQKSRIALAFLVSLLVAVPLASPFLWDLAHGGGESLARYKDVGFRGKATLLSIGRRYFDHIDGRFLFVAGDGNKRHHHGFLGQLNILLLPFLLMGLVALYRKIRREGDPFWMYALGILLASFVPPALTTEGLPHSLRSISAVVPLFLICILGFLSGPWSARSFRLLRNFAVVGVLLSMLSVVWYHYGYPARSTHMWYASTLVEAKWNSPDDVPISNHSIETVFDRLSKVIKDKDLRYCGQ